MTDPGAGPGNGISIGVALPQSARDGEQPGVRITGFARVAERLGFDSVWALDWTRGHQPMIEPMAALTAAAMATRRVRLGVAVLILPLRAPLEVARTSASLDRLSNGRLELGVGLGSNRQLVRSVGLDPARRTDRMIDSIELIRALWTGESVTFEGRTLSVRDWMIRPTPVQQPSPRIWFGGHHPDAVRRAAAMGDGFLGAGSVSYDDFRGEVAILREELARLGRDEAGFGLGKRIYLAIEDRRGARAAGLRRWIADYYRKEELADRVAVIGPPTAIVEAVLKVADLGGRVVILHPVGDEERQLRQLADEVLPAVRQILRDRGRGATLGRPGF